MNKTSQATFVGGDLVAVSTVVSSDPMLMGVEVRFPALTIPWQAYNAELVLVFGEVFVNKCPCGGVLNRTELGNVPLWILDALKAVSANYVCYMKITVMEQGLVGMIRAGDRTLDLQSQIGSDLRYRFLAHLTATLATS